MRPAPGAAVTPGEERPGLAPWEAGASDEELAAAVAAGSEAAFAELFRRYGGRLREFVRWRAGAGESRPEEVEELTQEVFFQLYRSLGSYRRHSSFRTWLYGLARNVLRHQRRRRVRRRRVEHPAGDLAPEALRGIPEPAPDAAELLASGELRREVRRRVAELPPLYRQVLVLRDLEGLSYAEIGALLEVPVGTVRSRLHGARARLAAAIVRRRRWTGTGALLALLAAVLVTVWLALGRRPEPPPSALEAPPPVPELLDGGEAGIPACLRPEECGAGGEEIWPAVDI